MMKGDFEKFKQMISDAEHRQGKMSTGEKAQLIFGSLEGIHLTSSMEARRIVQRIEDENNVRAQN